MAEFAWSMEIPSSSSGEIYTVTGYDDNSTTCTCRFGSTKGLIPAGARGCKHIRQALNQQRLGFQETQLTVAWTDKEIDFDSDAWIKHFCEIFSPVDYMKELVEATLREDNDHRGRMAKHEAGEGYFRPYPLPELDRSVLERLLETLSEFGDKDKTKSKADELAETFLHKALQARQVRGISNQLIAEAIRNSLCGNDTAWERLNPNPPMDTDGRREDSGRG